MSEKMHTASEQMMRQNMRMMRARSLVGAVMSKIDPFLDHDQDHVRKGVYEALLELFHSEGVDVITDAQRADAGLPPRGPDGWTMEEIVAIEHHRLNVLTAPIYARFPAPPSEE
jgi:hypothetical protein